MTSIRGCVICDGNSEAISHILLHCRSARTIWSSLQSCLNFDGRLASLISCYTIWRRRRINKSFRKVWDQLVLVECWLICKEKKMREPSFRRNPPLKQSWEKRFNSSLAGKFFVLKKQETSTRLLDILSRQFSLYILF